MKTPVKRRQSESGQAALLVILAMGIFLLGALGLAVDGSHLYAERQMAQAAADAAAQAGIMSIFDGTNTAGSTHYFSSTTGPHTCGSSDQGTPCYYAQTLNKFNGTGDTVTYEPNPSVSVPGLSSDPVNLLRVTVQRSVPTTLIRLLGPTASIIKATGTAAIVDVMSPVPIIVTHPSMAGALSSNGGPAVTICGGPSKSIQVNSFNTSAAFSMNSNTTINLLHAGPPDPGDCSSGLGADFGSFGGPGSATFNFVQGQNSHFQAHASPIEDPLADVPVPPVPSIVNPTPTSLANGVSGCPAAPSKPCFLYSPGKYTSGIDVKNQTGVFKPGIYYVTSGGFGASANGNMVMATGFTDGSTGTNTGWTGNMLVYNTGNGTADVFSVGSNGSASLVGSPTNSVYKGILLFEDRTAAAHVGPPAKNAHSLGGGGTLALVGTVYVTNTKAIMLATPSQYQELALQGTPGSSTTIQGEIITSNLALGGNAGITMNLNNLPIYKVRQAALVQ